MTLPNTLHTFFEVAFSPFATAPQAPFSLPLLRTLLASVVRGLRVDLRPTPNRSSVSIPGSLAIPALQFSTPTESRSYLSADIQMSFSRPNPAQPSGAVDLDMPLSSEAGGRALPLSVRLILRPTPQGHTYGAVHVDCPHAVIAKIVEAFFLWAYTREAIAHALSEAVRQSRFGIE